jgi:peptidoglycan/xylan/chitin deacetylase (PgdA/CDA1 family)
MYHRIAEPNHRSMVKGHYVSPRLFRSQLKLLQRLGYASVSLDSMFEQDGREPAKPIVFTFDDGYENFYWNALPAMEAAGFKGTVFLVSNCIGKSNTWDELKGDVHEKLMSRDQILDARRRGMEFGSHTLDHVDLSAVEPDEAWRQIADSRCDLEAMLGSRVQTFCYPYGRKTPAVQEMVSRAGYRVACAIGKGVNYPETDRMALRRINVRQDTSPPVLFYKLLRGLRVGR